MMVWLPPVQLTVPFSVGVLFKMVPGGVPTPAYALGGLKVVSAAPQVLCREEGAQ